MNVAELCERQKRENTSTDYLSRAVAPWFRGHVIKWVAETIRQHTPTAQAIAFRGMSGALVAPTVAMELGLNVIGIRKGESNHNGEPSYPFDMQGERVRRYVIVDDFPSSWQTVKEIAKTIARREMSLLGMFFYSRTREYTDLEKITPDILVPAWGCMPPEYQQVLP